jgi:hypothetical protein
LAICFTGSLERRPGFDPYKTIQIPVYFLGTGDAGLCDLKRICVASLDQFSDLCNSKPGNFQLCHEMIPRCPMASSTPEPGIVGVFILP